MFRALGYVCGDQRLTLGSFVTHWLVKLSSPIDPWLFHSCPHAHLQSIGLPRFYTADISWIGTFFSVHSSQLESFVALMHTSSIHIFMVFYKVQEVRLLSKLGLGNIGKGTSIAGCLWEYQLEPEHCAIKGCLWSPWLYLCLPLNFRKSSSEFTGISDMSSLYTDPTPGAGAGPGKGICRNLTFHPSIWWAEGQATHAVEVELGSTALRLFC